jgi:hypothetical protein
MEKWVSISGFDGRYEVSSLGQFKISSRIAICKNGNKRAVKEKIKKQSSFGDSLYRSINLVDSSGKNHLFPSHRIVALHFIPNPDNKPEVNHINGNPSDNRVENLEWCTRSENSIHAINTGLQKAVGEENPISKLSNDQVLSIFNSNLTQQELASIYNVDRTTISLIKTGKNWGKVTGKKFIKKKVSLTSNQIKEISSSMEFNTVLAKKYGVGQHYVGRIKRGI